MPSSTRTMESIARCVTAVAVAVVVLTAPPVLSQVSSDQPAAILTYPRIAFATEEGIDTVIQLTNASDAPVTVRCFYQRAELNCGYTAFTVSLTSQQPIAWHASSGLPTLPLNDSPTNGQFNIGLIPPVPDDPYDGSLACITVNDSDAHVPISLNVLIGQATVEQRRTPPTPLLDSSAYRAIGIGAHPGGNNGDAALVLGGSSAEYAACPLALTPMHFFDGAIDPVSKTSSISTSLVLISCSQNLTDIAPRDVTIQYDVANEFEQRLHTTGVLHGCAPIGPLSQIDTAIPERSIFHAGVMGTLTGQTRIAAKDNAVGLLGLMIETHQDVADATHTRTTMFTTPYAGVRAQRDAIVLPDLAPPECVGDCNNDLAVTVDELLTGVTMALGTSSPNACPQGNRILPPFDANFDGQVTIDDVLKAVNNALFGCL